MTEPYEHEPAEPHQRQPEPDEAAVPDPDRQVPDPTGHAVVDEALAGLARSADLPPAEQVAAYEATHRVLQQTLATIDQT